MELDFIRERITELRMKKGVSESRMSSDLGHNKNYIQHIVSGKSNPSVQELLYIIDYLGVSPRLFFDEGNQQSILAKDHRRAEGHARIGFTVVDLNDKQIERRQSVSPHRVRAFLLLVSINRTPNVNKMKST